MVSTSVFEVSRSLNGTPRCTNRLACFGTVDWYWYIQGWHVASTSHKKSKFQGVREKMPFVEPCWKDVNGFLKSSGQWRRRTVFYIDRRVVNKIVHVNWFRNRLRIWQRHLCKVQTPVSWESHLYPIRAGDTLFPLTKITEYLQSGLNFGVSASWPFFLVIFHSEFLVPPIGPHVCCNGNHTTFSMILKTLISIVFQVFPHEKHFLWVTFYSLDIIILLEV